MSDPLVLLERDGDVVTLTFNDPERRNAMTEAMGRAFSTQVAELADDDSLRVVILTGAGRAFSAGGDLNMIQARADEAAAAPGVARDAIRDRMRAFYKLFLAVRDLPCPTIAAINGAAIGAGLCVALGCDVRLANAEAKLGLNFTALGLEPGMGATWTLPRLVGPAHAAELLYSSRLFLGEEAAGIGLVNRALPAEQVLPEARQMGAAFARAAPLANRAVKRSLARSLDSSLEDQLFFEAQEQAICFESQDVHEGLAAARQRRPPKFQGR
ncbi:MAG: enoyl-CoA hydratase/isomerase family protein [Deltaproteobacteria bacterium]|nr:MAG: enoyl-CoA hydratase/isomerase family protein [Deltaproteobacteria bacterium]